jgi:hypothetical protein
LGPKKRRAPSLWDLGEVGKLCPVLIAGHAHFATVCFGGSAS